MKFHHKLLANLAFGFSDPNPTTTKGLIHRPLDGLAHLLNL